jgi:hypothetical protein
MLVHEIFRQSAARATNYVSASPSDKNLVKSNWNVETPVLEKLSGQHLECIVAILMFLLMTGVVIFHKFQLLHQVNSSKHPDTNPCKNCRFFSDNTYFKCAVHPDTVLTKAASNCHDYCPQPRKFSVFSLTR